MLSSYFRFNPGIIRVIPKNSKSLALLASHTIFRPIYEFRITTVANANHLKACAEIVRGGASPGLRARRHLHDHTQLGAECRGLLNGLAQL